ncbi:hypothetical protein KCMC57_64680 (plasmid) [Kitasatospora sp. CMC57]|uniref:DNA polymerase III beta sliding clamp central domain-containing protein n=1 Tax=Kitasatospora sp. CMC57 TaxID=3231513 RepID=A0AB33KBD4_9ACTN
MSDNQPATPEPVGINARRLSHILTEATPHMSEDDRLPMLQGIRLEADGTNLFALATDRYTFAVARTHYTQTGRWAVTVPAVEVDVLQAWLAAHHYVARITIEPADTTITFTGERGTLQVRTETAGEFPAWRGLFATALRRPAEEMPFSAWDSEKLARWQAPGRLVRVWQSAQNQPLLLIADGMLGLQMPCRHTGGTASELHEAAIGDWLDALGESSSPAEPADVLPAKPTGATTVRTVADLTEVLLHQVIRSTSDLTEAPSTDPGAVAAHAIAGNHAWMGYRLMEALHRADPDLAATTVADLGEQLDSGEISEWAWDAATEAGHDPVAWIEQHEKHRAETAARRAAATEAAANQV